MITNNQALEIFENIIMKIKLTLVDLYGNNIITYKDISLVCKLDQYIDNFPTWIANKKER